MQRRTEHVYAPTATVCFSRYGFVVAGETRLPYGSVSRTGTVDTLTKRYCNHDTLLVPFLVVQVPD